MFSSLDLRIAMPHETNLFSAVNRDFRILMKATEKNPNVLQACSRISKSTVCNRQSGQLLVGLLLLPPIVGHKCLCFWKGINNCFLPLPGSISR